MAYVQPRPVPLGLRLRRHRRRFAKRFPRTAYAGRRLRANAPFTAYALITFALMAYVVEELAPLA